MISGKKARELMDMYNNCKGYLSDKELVSLIHYYSDMIDFFNIGVPNHHRLGLIIEQQGLTNMAWAREVKFTEREAEVPMPTKYEEG